MAKNEAREARLRRHERVREKVSGTAARPRLCVFRSLNNIYVQLIDDAAGKTLVSASSLDAELKEAAQGKAKAACGELVGALAAKRALGQGINEVVFDRGGYMYHGRVKAVAEAARQGGLKF